VGVKQKKKSLTMRIAARQVMTSKKVSQSLAPGGGTSTFERVGGKTMEGEGIGTVGVKRR